MKQPSNYSRLKLKVDGYSIIPDEEKILCYCYTAECDDFEPEHKLRLVLFNEIDRIFSDDSFLVYLQNSKSNKFLWHDLADIINTQEKRTDTVLVYEDFDVEKEIDAMISTYNNMPQSGLLVTFNSGAMNSLRDLKQSIINHRNAQHAKDINNLLNNQK